MGTLKASVKDNTWRPYSLTALSASSLTENEKNIEFPIGLISSNSTDCSPWETIHGTLQTGLPWLKWTVCSHNKQKCFRHGPSSPESLSKALWQSFSFENPFLSSHIWENHCRCYSRHKGEKAFENLSELPWLSRRVSLFPCWEVKWTSKAQNWFRVRASYWVEI